MKKNFYFALVNIVLLFSVNSFAQTITTSPISRNDLCASDTTLVIYTATGTFLPENYFIAQISSDNFATFRNIGFNKSFGSGTIIATIPDDITQAVNYRIRVISRNPYAEGNDNGSDLRVYSKFIGTVSLYSQNVYGGVDQDFLFQPYFRDMTNFITEWDFGMDAIPQTFNGDTPPPVHYTSRGIKTVTLNVNPAKSCTWPIKATLNVVVYDCRIQIDTNAFIDTVKYSDTGMDLEEAFFQAKEFQQFWILPNGSIDSKYINPFPDHHTIFLLETGASITVGDWFGTLFYLKPGSSLTINGSSSSNVFVVAPGSSVIVKDSHYDTTIHCTNLKFDYSAAPKKGIDALIALGYNMVGEEISALTNLQVIPNPASDYITITVGANGCSPESIKIFDVFGREYLTPTLSTSGEGVRIDVSSLSTGVYLVRVGNKVQKFVKY